MTTATQEVAIVRPNPVVRPVSLAGFDRIFRWASRSCAVLVLLVLLGIMGSMMVGGWPVFQKFGLSFITTSIWDVNNDNYGAWPAIVGTLTTALVALVIGVPIS